METRVGKGGKGILYDNNCRQICVVDYQQTGSSILLRPQEETEGPVEMKSYLLPEGQTFPFQINLFPLPNKLRDRSDCTMVAHPRHHDQGRNTWVSERVPVDLSGTICNPENTGATVQNLSSGGLMLFSDLDFAIGDEFQLQLQLQDVRLPVKLQVRSKIPVGLKDGTTTLGYGCMFEDQGPVTRLALQRYLDRLTEKSRAHEAYH